MPVKPTGKLAVKPKPAKPLTNKQKASLKRAEEAARLVEEARVAEEARLLEEQRLAEEEELQRRRFSDPKEQLKDLIQWLSVIPLSTKCFTRIDREFSDGVLVAEIINYYLPELKIHDYVKVRYYSSPNKMVNWENLNTNAFSKLGFRVRKKMLCNIVQPWGCGKSPQCPNELFIYKLLFKLRASLAKVKESLYNYRKPRNEENTTECTGKSKPEKKVRRTDQTIGKKYGLLSKIEWEIASGKYNEEDDKDKADGKKPKTPGKYDDDDCDYDEGKDEMSPEGAGSRDDDRDEGKNESKSEVAKDKKDEGLVDDQDENWVSVYSQPTQCIYNTPTKFSVCEQCCSSSIIF